MLQSHSTETRRGANGRWDDDEDGEKRPEEKKREGVSGGGSRRKGITKRSGGLMTEQDEPRPLPVRFFSLCTALR